MLLGKLYQGSLFDDDCSTNCEAYAACGGQRATAPCGCVWTRPTGLQYQCHKCYLICRERGLYNTNAGLNLTNFATNIEDGYTFDQIQINQAKYSLPIYIPVNTDKYLGGTKFSGCVAVDARMLFNRPRNKAAVLKPQFENEYALRQYLHVTENCRLIAVLNGEDKMLERIWAMPRTDILAKLVSIGFAICTGPTFSLTALTTAGTSVPFSHHTVMLMRHHRMLSEIADAGLCGVPNLYWLDGDNRQLNQWAAWLKEATNVSLVSRDFTSTRHWSAIQPKLHELISLLKEVGRPFHVLIIGTGHSNAPKIVQELSHAGYSVSIITSAPIMKAIHGSQYYLSPEGKLTDGPSNKSEHSFDTLIKYNLDIFEKKLKASVA